MSLQRAPSLCRRKSPGRPIAARFDTALAAQQAIVDRWRFLSPAIAAHDALVTLSGTSGDRYREFQRQVDAYVGALEQYFVPIIVRGAHLTSGGVSAMPSFEFREPPAREAYGRAGIGVLGIALACVLAGGTAAVRLRRVPLVEG
jgi:ABC-2 type transport system permease protein